MSCDPLNLNIQIIICCYCFLISTQAIGEEESDPNDTVPEDWVEGSQDEGVLKHAEKVPENLRDIKEEEIVIWVDPVDGTAEYTQGGFQSCI